MQLMGIAVAGGWTNVVYALKRSRDGTATEVVIGGDRSKSVNGGIDEEGGGGGLSGRERDGGREILSSGLSDNERDWPNLCRRRCR